MICTFCGYASEKIYIKNMYVASSFWIKICDPPSFLYFLPFVAVSLTNPFKDFLVSFLHGNAPFVHVATMVAKNLAKVLIKMAAFHAVI